MSGKSLKKSTLSGMVWSAVQRFGMMIISFVSNVVLARMLTPDDYGCVGMLAIFILVSNTFVDGGFGSALIQKKEPTQTDYSTIFWWNVFLAIFLYLLLYFLAPAISQFYSIPLLEIVLRVQGLVLIFNALNIIPSVLLKRYINFKRLARINLFSAIMSSLIAIVMAWHGYGIWSLVIQNLLMSFIVTIILWSQNTWKPQMLYSWTSFKHLFRFGGYLLSSNLINTFCNNVQGLLIGRFFLPSIMGYYTQARKLEEIASHSFSTIVEQVSFPIMSQFQHDNEKMRNVVNKFISSLAYIIFPLMSILILIAHPLIMIIYGEKWLPCIPYFQILCVAGIAISMQGFYYYTVASRGESKALFVRTVIIRTISLMIIFITMYMWGIYGLLWGVVIGSWIFQFANVYLVQKYIGYSMMQQFKDLLPIILLSIVTFVIIYVVRDLLVFNMYINTIIIVCLYIMVYLSLSHIFKIKAFNFLKDILIGYVKK